MPTKPDTDWLLSVAPFALSSYCQTPDVVWHKNFQPAVKHTLQALVACLTQRAEAGQPIPPRFTETTQFEVDVTWCDNATIQALNAEHRNKNEATDVLSFPMAVLPGVSPANLGSVVVSLDWAQEHAELGEIEPYLLERLTHGLLHVMGLHHDTMCDYEEVVAIQRWVLDWVLAQE